MAKETTKKATSRPAAARPGRGGGGYTRFVTTKQPGNTAARPNTRQVATVPGSVTAKRGAHVADDINVRPGAHYGWESIDSDAIKRSGMAKRKKGGTAR